MLLLSFADDLTFTIYLLCYSHLENDFKLKGERIDTKYFISLCGSHDICISIIFKKVKQLQKVESYSDTTSFYYGKWISC